MSGPNQIWTFMRFLIVGGSFSLGYALVTAGLINFAEMPPLLTSVMVYLLCIPLAFLAQKKFTFRDGRSGKTAMLIYGATQLGSLAIVSTITSRFVTRNFVIDTALFLATAGMAAVVSYLICRYVIFRPRSV
ncbi:GtrA family protein [Roseobacter sp. CCS2]|uniref:GtrA family protein n=1 Tax=Roseobacter sp. CCS2 TaxID=391593 RepID=UPI0000F40339|nr:GtrA family protein [Roseobacter sp. CCS2]EBA13903.1 hypothetical protein RCCS2_08439 [Roseobacter sp. CCS2]